MAFDALIVEFPYYKTETLPVIPDGWVDISWHNDMCPSFRTPSNKQVFIDYEDPNMRDAESFRFCVTLLDEHGEALPDGSFVETDDWNEVLRWV